MLIKENNMCGWHFDSGLSIQCTAIHSLTHFEDTSAAHTGREILGSKILNTAASTAPFSQHNYHSLSTVEQVSRTVASKTSAVLACISYLAKIQLIQIVCFM